MHENNLNGISLHFQEGMRKENKISGAGSGSEERYFGM